MAFSSGAVSQESDPIISPTAEEYPAEPSADGQLTDAAFVELDATGHAAPGACPVCGKPAPAPPAKPPRECKTCCRGCLLDWSKYPETISPMPRPGIFPIPRTDGPAYFSVLDQLHGRRRDAPPKSGYAPFAINAWPYFDADWRYVDGLEPGERTTVEQLKRIHLNECLLFSTGGDFWLRYHDEHNSRLTEVDNDYTLGHVRVFGDVWYSDWLRVYGEYVWADSWGEDLAPSPPDVDRGDILDLFVDVKLFEYRGHPVYARGGRQELLYGSQRLITPLPWANKRHTFQGVKVFRQGEKWDFDAWWTQFVPPDPDDFDTADENQTFVGSWLTHRPEKGRTVDFYYLMFDNGSPAAQQGIVRSPFQLHTFGNRWAGDKEGWLWDVEAAIQFGQQNNNGQLAGMATAGVGRHWKQRCLKPTLWIYYDYASGDSDPNSGDVHTFNQLFPFGHYYLGWMDLVGRQNIHDLNCHLYLYPAPWLTVWLQYHHFWLDQSRDALYNAGGVAYRRDPSGQAGTNVGDEIDLVFNFHVGRYTDVLISYNKLFGGSFLEATAGPNRAVDAETLYLLFQQRW
jgi:hypothetical protein